MKEIKNERYLREIIFVFLRRKDWIKQFRDHSFLFVRSAQRKNHGQDILHL